MPSLMPSREMFFDRVAAVGRAAGSHNAIDVFPPNDSHNMVSRMLRSALTVATFSFMEAYLEDRFAEIMPVISKTSINHHRLPSRFQHLVSVKAIKGIANRLQFEKENPLRLAEDQIKSLSGYFRRRRNYSYMGFSPTGSNVTNSHVVELLGDLGVVGGWDTLNGILDSFEFSSVSLSDAFNAFSIARNKCAHDPLYDIQTDDLKDHRKTAIRVGVAFDIAVTAAAKCYEQAADERTLESRLRGLVYPLAIVETDANAAWKVTFQQRLIGTFRTQRMAERAARQVSSISITRDSQFIPVRIA